MADLWSNQWDPLDVIHLHSPAGWLRNRSQEARKTAHADSRSTNVDCAGVVSERGSPCRRIEAETAEESDIHYKKNLAVETATLREKLLSSTLAKGGAISFIELLEATGRDVGARTSIESVSTKDNAKLSNIEELRLALKVTGPWPAVVRLLGLLELLPYETELDQVVVSKVESPEEGSWRADLLLTTLKEK